ncbi:CU044_5270 family protein [Nocardiopsis algeriensis]|uniref:CU044_5270 family protein n=1 Tax=Nocardiopsis algeriensis TaxID=1478215 RepID=UPI003B431C4F
MRHETDPLETVAALRPRAVDEHVERIHRRNRDGVLERARTQGAAGSGRAGALGRFRRPLMVSGAVLTAVSAAAAGALLFTPSATVVVEAPAPPTAEGSRPPQYADARELLMAASAAAAEGEDPQEGDIWYVRSHQYQSASFWGDGFEAHQQFVEEAWWTASTTEPSTLGNYCLDAEEHFPTEEDRAAWERDGSPPLVCEEPRSNRASGNIDFVSGLAADELLELPGEPGELEDLLRERRREYSGSGSDLAEEDFDEFLVWAAPITVTLYLPADTRAAYYEILAGIDGMRLAGEAVDPLGRTGIKVEVPGRVGEDGESSHYWIMDARTGELLSRHLGENWIAFEEYGLVEEVGEPAAPLGG